MADNSHTGRTRAPQTPAALFPRLEKRDLSIAHPEFGQPPSDVTPEDLKIFSALERWCSLMLAEDPNTFEATPADHAIWAAQAVLAAEIMAMPATGVHGLAVKTWLGLRGFFGPAGGATSCDNFMIDLPNLQRNDDPGGAKAIWDLAQSCLKDSPYLAACLDAARALVPIRPAA